MHINPLPTRKGTTNNWVTGKPNTPPRTATCHPDRPYYSRHLCRACYDTVTQKGQLHEHATHIRPLPEVIAAHHELTAQGKTARQIADHLGMKYPAYHMALRRARTKGLIT